MLETENETGARDMVALAYLRPYRERWVCPLDIMRLPPADFQGWHIEISGETMTLTRGAEMHPFSLKKLIVRVEKELNRLPERLVSTPRELAKLLIRSSVESHRSVEDVAHSGCGMGWYGYDVSCSGIISARRRPGGKFERLKVDCWHILVAEFEGEDGPWIFGLREIYHEIEQEVKQGFTVVQPTLF